MNEQEKNNINGNDVDTNQTLEEITENIANQIRDYKQYKDNEATYSFGSKKNNIVTKNPIIAQFFVYPIYALIFLLGTGMILFSPGEEKIVGCIIVLIIIYLFVKFRKNIREFKNRIESIKSDI